jgi:hypothetical protein
MEYDRNSGPVEFSFSISTPLTTNDTPSNDENANISGLTPVILSIDSRAETRSISTWLENTVGAEDEDITYPLPGTNDSGAERRPERTQTLLVKMVIAIAMATMTRGRIRITGRPP